MKLKNDFIEMITQNENNQYLKQFNTFVADVADFKALLTANGIDFSIDIDVLSNAVRMPIFQQLLAADKGLKLRFDLLKTDAGKLNLIAQTIDLAGYDVIDSFTESLEKIRTGYENNNGVHRIGEFAHFTFDDFARIYQLNLPAALDSVTINFTGKEYALAYFSKMAGVLNEVRHLFHSAGFACRLDDAVRTLAALYDVECDQAANQVPGGKLELKEMAVWQLLNRLTERNALAAVPGAPKG